MSCACVTALAAAGSRVKERDNKETIGSLGSSEDTDTAGTVQFQAHLHINAIMSYHVLCFLHAVHHFVALFACPGLELYVTLHRYTGTHRSNWDSLIKQHSECI